MDKLGWELFSLVKKKSLQKEGERKKGMGKGLVLTPCPGPLPHSYEPHKNWDHPEFPGRTAGKQLGCSQGDLQEKWDHLEFLVAWQGSSWDAARTIPPGMRELAEHPGMSSPGCVTPIPSPPAAPGQPGRAHPAGNCCS